MATSSIIGTEDDETFYLLMEERKERARRYVEANKERLNKNHREYYLRRKESYRKQNQESTNEQD